MLSPAGIAAIMADEPVMAMMADMCHVSSWDDTACTGPGHRHSVHFHVGGDVHIASCSYTAMKGGQATMPASADGTIFRPPFLASHPARE